MNALKILALVGALARIAGAASTPAFAADAPAASGADAASPDRDLQEKAFADRYAILIERNVFAKDRPRRYVRPTDPRRERSEREAREARDRPRSPQPEESLLLTGVVREGDVYMAFIENTRSGTTTRTKVGDTVGRGKITAITMISLTHEVEGRAAVLEIGKTLSGGAPDRSRSTETQASSTETPSGSAPTGAANDIIERMRQRRLQEAKK